MCVSMCVCARVRSPCVPGCPCSIGLTLYSIPQGGPGLCASEECQGEGEQQTAESNATDADTDRNRVSEGKNTTTKRLLPHVLLGPEVNKG